MRPLQAARKHPEVVAGLLATAGLAWWLTADRMAGMDAGPGTDVGALGWFTGPWAVMMAAMLDPVPLRGAGREVADIDLELDLVWSRCNSGPRSPAATASTSATDIARSSTIPARPFQELQIDRRRRSPKVGAGHDRGRIQPRR
jgi:hypothetical protein